MNKRKNQLPIGLERNQQTAEIITNLERIALALEAHNALALAASQLSADMVETIKQEFGMLGDDGQGPLT